ncbi:MAG: DUF4395 domain-containing protein [Chloroflexi bacterium]|nr:DUF4395 domain-containing protein [Chloroflexota bacterium]
MNERIEKVDHSAIRVNQASIISLLLIAFVLNGTWLVAAVALVMLVGAALGQPGFRWIYAGILKPSGIVKPDYVTDNPEPHIFAQGMGGIVLVLSVVGLVSGSALIGWALAWLVVALAALNLFVGFCAGCFVYYWLSRLHLPGFAAHPPSGTFPGMRPTRKAG